MLRARDRRWHAEDMNAAEAGSGGARGRSSSVDQSDSLPFGRGISLFDAVYGFAMTLLIANVDPLPPAAWQSFDALATSGAVTQLLGFALSFVVIAVIWRANVRLMRRLSGMDGPVTALNLLATGLVILIAFTTQGISDPATTDLPIPTALYALNIAAVSLTQTVMYQVARARGLEDPVRPAGENRREVLMALITPLVFVASVPIAVCVGAVVAKRSWLTLVIVNPLAGLLRFPAQRERPLSRRDAVRRR